MASNTIDVPKPMGTAQVPLPYITIKFCVQCKWNLRAAYFAQELFQTFSIAIGSISLVPVTGGIFTITILHAPAADPSSSSSSSAEPTETLLWDRKAEGGFPETKDLKNRVRNIIDPARDMGHIDRRLKKDREGKEGEGAENQRPSTQMQMSTSTATAAHPPTEMEGKSNVPWVSETSAQQRQEECEDCK